MKAMIFAAGRGERMRPLTDTLPKPLARVAGKPLIVYHVLNLVRAGIVDIVINHSHLGYMIEAELGDGSRYGARIVYSHEPTPLETAGGIVNALHLLGEEPFLALSGDIFAPDFDFKRCKETLTSGRMDDSAVKDNRHPIACLYLTPNPWHNLEGDFGLAAGTVSNTGAPRWNFANIGVYRPEMFAGITQGQSAKLGPLMRHYADQGQVSGKLYEGHWVNVGTIAQLDELNFQQSTRMAD
jgi:MurNAc alpha-1-phosphate uridylyltransferase